MKQPIAIVGASVRAAAASAVRAGLQPLAADLFADLDLRQIATSTRIDPYPDALLDWLRAVEPPAWMYTGALENHPELVDQMAWIAPLWGNPGDVLQRVRSPWELAVCLHQSGFNFPETRPSANGLPRDGSWLWKSYQGASGSGVRTLDTAFDTNPCSHGNTGCFQQRVVGVPCSAVFVGCNGSAWLLGITRQLIGQEWLGAHGFQFAGSIGPWPIGNAAHQRLACLGHMLASEFELTGLFGVDFILDGDDVWPIEVNPRYTASVEVIERFTDISAMAAHIAAFTSPQHLAARVGNPRESNSPSSCHGKSTLFARRDIVITPDFAEAILHEALKTPWPALADISAGGTPVESGRPILTLFADAPTVDGVELNLRNRVLELENMLYQH